MYHKNKTINTRPSGDKSFARQSSHDILSMQPVLLRFAKIITRDPLNFIFKCIKLTDTCQIVSLISKSNNANCKLGLLNVL